MVGSLVQPLHHRRDLLSASARESSKDIWGARACSCLDFCPSSVICSVPPYGPNVLSRVSYPVISASPCSRRRPGRRALPPTMRAPIPSRAIHAHSKVSRATRVLRTSPATTAMMRNSMAEGSMTYGSAIGWIGLPGGIPKMPAGKFSAMQDSWAYLGENGTRSTNASAPDAFAPSATDGASPRRWSCTVSPRGESDRRVSCRREHERIMQR